MSQIAAALLAELEREAKTTRRVLERVPADRLAWKPHPKSMTLGQLAGHVAGIPGGMSRRARAEGMDMPQIPPAPAQPDTETDFAVILDAGIAEARDFLASLEDAEALTPWRMTHAGREIFAIPRIAMLRTMLLNHWYHHRGQLALYLRMLDVPVPAIYGRSADETPWLAKEEVKESAAVPGEQQGSSTGTY